MKNGCRYFYSPYCVMIGNKFKKAWSAEEAIDILTRGMTCNEADVIKQMKETGEADVVYGFCHGFIYKNPIVKHSDAWSTPGNPRYKAPVV